jgi:hypothetical protein
MTLTLQQVFDKAATHLLKQGERSEGYLDIDESELVCMYRGPEGRMCAVGALISDEAYSTALEGKRTSSEHVRAALKESGCPVDPTAGGLYVRLQQIHDAAPESEWKTRLAARAREFNLNTDAIDAL